MSNWFRTYGFGDVLDDLLIGAYPIDQSDVEMLAWMGVERVLNLVEESEYRHAERDHVVAAYADAGIEEHRVSMVDYEGLPSDAIEQAVQEVLAWLAEGKRVYVHCRAGRQRSAAVAAGVVALREGLDIDEALAFIQSRKPSADPLPHQREDLERWWSQREESTPVQRTATQRPAASEP
jgi:atypical dual specificity phosphatase